MKTLYSILSGGNQNAQKPSSSTSGMHQESVVPEHSWDPGYFRHIPWLGLGALLVTMLGCTGLAIFTILKSDGKVVSEWPYRVQPSEILAYTSTTATWLMTVALADGASKFFWRQAILGKVPLANLHYHWKAATGALSALDALRHRRAVRVSVVTILMAATNLLRGPMMQRALSVRTVQAAPNGTLELGVLPTTQVWDLEPTDDYEWKHPFWDVVREYQAKTPIRIPGAESCNNCTVTVEASGKQITPGIVPWETVPCLLLTDIIFEQLFGFDYSSSTSDSFLFNFSERPTNNVSRRDEDTFRIKSGANAHYVTISVKRKMDEGCDTHITTTEHFLYPASVKHKLLLDGGNATFLSNSWSDDYVVGRRELVPSSNYTMSPRLNYFRVMVDKLWAAQTTLTVAWGNVTIEDTLEEGVFYDPIITEQENRQDAENKVQYRVHSDGLLSDLYQQGRSDKCGPNFRDPMDDILNTYRELTLRLAIRDAIDRNNAAIAAGDNTGKSEVFQNVEYTRSHQIRAEYAANTTNLAVAVLISVLGPLGTCILFWRFWELGRDFSISPLELANAFLAGSPPRTATAETDSDTNRTVTITESEVTGIAPNHNQLATILAGCSSNASAEEIVSHIRKVSKEPKEPKEPTVQYGVLNSTNRLGFAVLGSEGVARLPKKQDSP